MLELYYTSAPEGLKPGSRGFCSVAASEALQKQKQLWDRLEALSGYRHHFQHNGQVTGARNPVSHAHWLLNLLGKEYHVLSRVCDSGTDYTQRTNAFAHHVVLDGTELPEVGPGALLKAEGLLASSWNNAGGALPVRSLDPFLNHRPASLVAQSWADLTGDAGHAAILAQAAERAPRTPVCILFAPEQSDLLLPLLAEALALLPAAVRWQITFNTYFTSMPTSASCAWRCCLVKTPAADAALRYASGNTSGVVLNLTDLSKIPAVPATALATLARTGMGPGPKTPAKAAAKAGAPEAAAAVPVGKEVAVGETAEAMVLDVTEDDFSPAPAYPKQTSGVRGGKGPVKAVPAATRAPGYITVAAPGGARGEVARESGGPRLWVVGLMILFVIFALSGLIYFGMQLFGPGPLPPPEAPPKRVPTTTVSVAEPVPVPTTVAVTHPVIETTTTKAAATATAPVVATTTNVVVPPKVARIAVVKTALVFHPSGSSMRDQVQALNLTAAEFEAVPLRSATGLSLLFPGDKATWTIDGKNDEPAGTFSAESNKRDTRPGFTVKWKDGHDPTASGNVLTIHLDKKTDALEVTWHNSTALRHPEISTLAFWVLQNSTVAADSGAAGKVQRIVFRSMDSKALSLADATAAIEYPCDLPVQATPANSPGLKLPAGWVANGAPDWPEVKDPAARTAQNAVYLMRFKKATSVGAIDAFFVVTFKGGFTSVESTFGAALANGQSDVTRAQAELDAIGLDIKSVTAEANADIANQSNPVEIQTRKNNLANAISAKELKRAQTELILKGSTEALAGYREMQKAAVDVPLTLPDGMVLTTLHFVGGK